MNYSTYQDAMQTVQRLQETTKQKFGDYGFSCGYLGSLLSSVLSELPEEKREQYLRQMESTIDQYGEEVTV